MCCFISLWVLPKSVDIEKGFLPLQFRMSSKSAKSHPSSTLPNNTTKAGVVVETMSAPNPFCPNTRGVCCLMVLVNLAIILVAIGFIIVLQLHDPTFVSRQVLELGLEKE